jgi:hypothetical protein
MSGGSIERLRARARAVKTRAAVRDWRYRQRHLAAGVWFRLRRVLADARAAYSITDEDARALISEGCTPEPSGFDVTPEKTILFVGESRLGSLQARQPIPVGLGPEFLSARAIALIAFDDARR